ncbi:MAG TPA: NAD(P)-binding domain-containing protein [Tepidisphaeraceae bacterium]|nr:NAD(P)-binding domain-containing protein [Tepidisphaeraceae bacterium]
MTASTKTVGLLYPGEMGASLARLLSAGGARVVTCVEGRSEQTRSRCRAAEIDILGTVQEVVRQSDVIISLVPPGAAEAVAAAYCELAHLSPPHGLYVDCNSIAPQRAEAIAQRFAERGRGFIDGAINGLASNISSAGTLFLSGAQAGELAELIGDRMRIRLLGTQPGAASAMKMLLGGLSKGLCALFIETALIAQKRGMLPEMLLEYARIYPGVMRIVDRMLPTYPQHAARRAQETREIESTAREAGIEPNVLAAVRRAHEAIAVSFCEADSLEEQGVQTLIERLARDYEPLAFTK